jgi:integrase/recombinase XerD
VYWSNAGPVRRIFRSAFTSAGLPYYQPHTFRHLLARLGQQYCRTAEQMKAWSQNLAHEQMLTTFTSYGRVDDHRQGEIIQDLARSHGADDTGGTDRQLLEKIRRIANEIGG